MFYKSDDRVFYVYLHKCKSTQNVYYVGKGHKNRAWIPREHTYWRSLKESGELQVEILQDRLTEGKRFYWRVVRFAH